MGAECIQEVSSCHGNRYWRGERGELSAVAAGPPNCNGADGRRGMEKTEEAPNDEQTGRDRKGEDLIAQEVENCTRRRAVMRFRVREVDLNHLSTEIGVVQKGTCETTGQSVTTGVAAAVSSRVESKCRALGRCRSVHSVVAPTPGNTKVEEAKREQVRDHSTR